MSLACALSQLVHDMHPSAPLTDTPSQQCVYILNEFLLVELLSLNWNAREVRRALINFGLSKHALCRLSSSNIVSFSPATIFCNLLHTKL